MEMRHFTKFGILELSSVKQREDWCLSEEEVMGEMVKTTECMIQAAFLCASEGLKLDCVQEVVVDM